MHRPQILLLLRKKWKIRSLASLFKEVTVFKGIEASFRDSMGPMDGGRQMILARNVGVFLKLWFAKPMICMWVPWKLWGSPKASHIKASHPHFPHFPRFRVRIFRIFHVFRVFALRNLLRPLFFWGERDFPHFPHFPRIGSHNYRTFEVGIGSD